MTIKITSIFKNYVFQLMLGRTITSNSRNVVGYTVVVYWFFFYCDEFDSKVVQLMMMQFLLFAF